MNDPITITIDKTLLQETLIALRDRRHTLQQEWNRPTMTQTFVEIVARQLCRVDDCIDALATAIGEAP